MRRPIRTLHAGWLLAVLTAGGCRGGGTSGPATPVADPFVQIEELSRQDPTLLACSVVSLPSVIGFVPGTSASNRRRQDHGPGRTARASQREMALRDAAAAASRGGYSPSQAREITDRHVRETEGQISEATAGGSAVVTDRATLLREYTSMWAVLIAVPERAADASRRIEEIDTADPDMADRYARALLYATQEWAFDCGGP